MISTDLHNIADTLHARGEAHDPLHPAEMLALAAKLASLGDRALNMEARPVPHSARWPVRLVE